MTTFAQAAGVAIILFGLGYWLGGDGWGAVAAFGLVPAGIALITVAVTVESNTNQLTRAHRRQP